MASVTYSASGAVASNGSSSAGTDLPLTAGNGSGGTNKGGDVLLTAGAAVSTGVPGTFKANGDANMVFVSVNPTVATAVNFFTAPRACIVKSISQTHSVAAGGTSTATVTKDASTTAPGGGTSLHQSGSFDLNATANTVQTATLSTTVATVSLAAGDRLCFKFANAIQSSVGINVTVGLSWL